MGPEEITVVWREWFSDAAVLKLIELKTLPREEIKLDVRGMDGDEVAAEIAKCEHANGSEMFRESTRITILEPKEFAGDYHISVDYEPTFFAYQD